MAYYNFTQDLEDGQQVEREVMEKLTHYFLGITDLQQSTSKYYDIEGKWNNERLTFEVKNDLKAAQTNNIAIEYECRGVASGLAISTADYWVHKFLNEYYIFHTEVLKRKIFEEQQYHKTSSGGDLGSGTKLYLVKIPDFKSWGNQL